MNGHFGPKALLLLSGLLLVLGCTAPPERSAKPPATAETPAPAEVARTALVIGVGRDPSGLDLVTPLNDARLVARALARAGFRVLGDGPMLDPDRARLEGGLAALEAALAERRGIGLVWFAGPAPQIGGRNHLALAGEGTGTPDAALPLDRVVEAVRAADQRVVILSATRPRADLPHRRTRTLALVPASQPRPAPPARPAAWPGPAPVPAPPDTLIAFAAGPGSAVTDAADGNGLYAIAFAAALEEPSLPIVALFERVRETVASATGGRQTPWQASALRGEAPLAGPR